MNTIFRCSWITSALFVLCGASARAQCLDWDDRFTLSGLDGGGADVMAVFDDGTGPALYIGGGFTHAGSTDTARIVKWDGANWTPLDDGSGFSVSGVKALAVFDDGSGPALYVGGTFKLSAGGGANGLAKWDGSTWSGVGTGVTGSSDVGVYALHVFDDGGGAALYVGGIFDTAGGVATASVAKFDGTTWSAMDSGDADSACFALESFDDGAGAAIYAGGLFFAPDRLLLRWNGASWTNVAGIGGGPLQTLEVFDDGSGAALYAGGDFVAPGSPNARNVARWNGTTWSALGTGTQTFPGGSPVTWELLALDDGSGPALYAGGHFSTVGGVPVSEIAKWNGTTWSALGSGMVSPGPYITITALGSFDDGSGLELYAGGFFDTAGGVTAHRIAKWDGAAWNPLSAGMGVFSVFTHDVRAVATYDDGGGRSLFAGGVFLNAGPAVAHGIAEWNGTTWSDVDGGVSGGPSTVAVHALLEFDDGSGPALYAGGAFTTAGGVTVNNLGRWNGTSWSALGTGLNAAVYSLAIYDDGSGPALCAGGAFNTAGGNFANHVAKWNGTTWSTFGIGATNDVLALAAYDSGSGEELYAGGLFTFAGGINVNYFTKWNGTSWSDLGGMNQPVYSLLVHDDGSGSQLFIGGDFTMVDSSSKSRIAKWNGTSYSAVGTGTNSRVRAFSAFDDGAGPALYATGSFSTAGGNTANRVAKWDGTNWSALGTGLAAFSGGSGGYALAHFDDGDDGAPDLYVGGQFDRAGGDMSLALAEWHGCPPGEAYCFGDGVDSVVTALCPCANFGGGGRGCGNSNGALGGARLIASGTTSPNTLVFTCDGIPNNSFSTFLRSNASDDSGFVFGDGIKCLNGTGIRFGSQNAGQGGNPPFTVSSPAATVASGNTRYYQLHYRNPNAGFCPPETFNISNGYRVMW